MQSVFSLNHPSRDVIQTSRSFCVEKKKQYRVYGPIFFYFIKHYAYINTTLFIALCKFMRLYITFSLKVQVDVDLPSKSFFLFLFLQMDHNVYVAIKKKSVNAIFIIK